MAAGVEKIEGVFVVKLLEMLDLYRNTAAPNMLAIAAEFRQMTPSEQRELLFWMCVDASTNPTTVRTQNARTQ